MPCTLPTPSFHIEITRRKPDRLGEPLMEKLHGPPYEREAATSQSLTETCKNHSQVTHKVETRAVGSAEEWFVQAVSGGLVKRWGWASALHECLLRFSRVLSFSASSGLQWAKHPRHMK